MRKVRTSTVIVAPFERKGFGTVMTGISPRERASLLVSREGASLVLVKLFDVVFSSQVLAENPQARTFGRIGSRHVTLSYQFPECCFSQPV